MSRPHIRHELSQLESNLRTEIGKLAQSKNISLDTQTGSLCELIAILTQAGLCEHPLFGQITQVDAAVCQLDIGLYGLCSDCENEIETERLDINPVEQRCTQCAKSHEHEHRQELRLKH
ncbi:TraR/DksA family transcriptional regulator [Shewanella violacea]|uniref:DksA-type zinc finger protein n=1 Tax=Shewanella violacea (strain JCM 10179 / CIP 106290 / LMG 19151 / DSS12) TaxID=637905 RepID=D4ZM64_SHEVD|nr:TraR/DksA C4-type zinc finger protein [Shewanella violacea]BAJ02763.1 dksA-type zinc finger protein [Shewanella violacea DSS12]